MTLYKQYGLFMESMLEARIDLRVDEVWCMICTNLYAPNQNTHKFRSVAVAGEISGSGYTPGGVKVTGIGMTYTGSTRSLEVSAGTISWPNVTWTGARYGVVYAKAADSVPSDQPVITYIDFETGQDRSAAPFYINWPSGVLFSVDLP